MSQAHLATLVSTVFDVMVWLVVWVCSSTPGESLGSHTYGHKLTATLADFNQGVRHVLSTKRRPTEIVILALLADRILISTA